MSLAPGGLRGPRLGAEPRTNDDNNNNINEIIIIIHMLLLLLTIIIAVTINIIISIRLWGPHQTLCR